MFSLQMTFQQPNKSGYFNGVRVKWRNFPIIKINECQSFVTQNFILRGGNIDLLLTSTLHDGHWYIMVTVSLIRKRIFAKFISKGIFPKF